MKQNIFLLALTVGLVTAGALGAAGAPEDFDIKVMPASTAIEAGEGTAVSEEITMDLTLTTRIDDVSGWSYGAQVAMDAGVTATITSVVFPSDLLTVNNGNPPGFNTTAWFAPGDNTTGTPITEDTAGLTAGAVTQGVVVDLMQTNSLPASTDVAMLQVTVLVEATAPMAGADPICATLAFVDEVVGSPATATVIVHEGASIKPAVQEMGEVCISGIMPPECAPPVPYTINLSDDEGEMGDILESIITLNFNSDGSFDGKEISGWSLGACILDPTKAKCVEVTIDGMGTATVKNGGPPDFNNTSVFDNGATQGVVIDLTAQVTLPAQNGFTNLVLKCELLTDMDDDFTDVAACNETLGAPPVANVMVVDGASIAASEFEGGQDEVAPLRDGGLICDDAFDMGAYNMPGRLKNGSEPPNPVYVAGDANGDGRIDIADGIFLLSYLWRGGAAPACVASGDFNGDGAVDTTDAIALIYWQLQPAIEGAPFPGPDGDGECMEHVTELECATPCM